MCCDDEVIPTPSTPCGYTGADIECVGILTGDAIEVVVQKITDYLCALECCTNSEVSNIPYYTNTPLGIRTVAIIPATPTVITGTTYTIPVGEGGDYEIQYVGEYNTPTAGTLNLKLFKNLSEYSVITSKTVTLPTGPAVVPFIVFATNVALVAGDVLSIRGSANANSYPQNAVFKVTKIS
jgi:hypothetical protein